MLKVIKVEWLVKSTPGEVYYALTHAISLTEWMCDFATLAPHTGGRMYLWRHSDFYSAGESISLEENKSIQSKWHGSQDPAPSQEAVTQQVQEDGTLVSLDHTIPEEIYWLEYAQGFQDEWTRMLANMAQVLETGLDKRIFDRPMLGINASDFNAEIAQAMEVQVSDGIRLDFLPEEMGAYQAGLSKNELIIA